MTSLALPRFLMTSEKGSFARNTIEERKPAIIDQILLDIDYPPDIQTELLDFKTEMQTGLIQPLEELTPDRPVWDHDMRPFLGKTWLDIPWFLAEAYFYRRVLEIVRYFQPGPYQGMNPYTRLTDQASISAFPLFSSVYQDLPLERSSQNFRNFATKALWGNRADLSNLSHFSTDMSEQAESIIRDDSEEAFQHLIREPAKIVYFFDNVGKELFFDLAWIDFMLLNDLAQSVTCYLKNQPFFVSDVMPEDFSGALDQLQASPAQRDQSLAARLQNALRTGVLTIETPSFLTTGRLYRQLPEDLLAQIGAHDLAILKGDVNYRRLMGDRHWLPTTPVGRAAGYFPSSFLSLRTLKSELVVGLTDSQLALLQAEAEPDWLTNGNRGTITFLKR